jgi:hypothetical protein
VFMQGTRLSQFMKSVEQVAAGMGDADADADADSDVEANLDVAVVAQEPSAVPAEAAATPAEHPAPNADAQPHTEANAAADPWAAMLEAGAALLQGMAAARGPGGSVAAPMAIERDPVTGLASIRLPLPDPTVLQRLAKAFEPWLR